jgi:hypothetical protein
MCKGRRETLSEGRCREKILFLEGKMVCLDLKKLSMKLT